MVLVKEGGFSWKDLMSMPSWERKWYAEKLIEITQKAKDDMKQKTKK